MSHSVLIAGGLGNRSGPPGLIIGCWVVGLPDRGNRRFLVYPRARTVASHPGFTGKVSEIPGDALTTERQMTEPWGPYEDDVRFHEFARALAPLLLPFLLLLLLVRVVLG